jgi:hypothetical protein
MMKPVDYRETFMISRDLPYRSPPARSAGACEDQGTPHLGRIVSLQKGLTSDPAVLPVSAYSGGLGLVMVNARWLNRMR